MTAPALGAPFLDWWFAPWRLPHAPQAWPGGVEPGPLARRHGYRLWCDAAGVPPDLPDIGAPQRQPEWQCLAPVEAGRLEAAARLYAGLLAARERDNAALARLHVAERRWCMSVALTQPLPALCAPPADVADDVAADVADDVADDVPDALTRRGLAELATALETGFPGLWARLRLLVRPALAVAPQPVAAQAAGAAGMAGSARLPRCWRLCLDRAAQPLAEAA